MLSHLRAIARISHARCTCVVCHPSCSDSHNLYSKPVRTVHMCVHTDTHTQVVSALWRPKNRGEPSRRPKIPSVSPCHMHRGMPLPPGRPHTLHTWSLRVALYSRHLGDDTVSRTKTTLTNPTKTNSRVCGEGQPSAESGNRAGAGGTVGKGRGSLVVRGWGKVPDLSTTLHPTRPTRKSRISLPRVRRGAGGVGAPLPHATARGNTDPPPRTGTERGTRTHKKAITQRGAAQPGRGREFDSPPLRIPPPPPQSPSPRAAVRRAGRGAGRGVGRPWPKRRSPQAREPDQGALCRLRLGENLREPRIHYEPLVLTRPNQAPRYGVPLGPSLGSLLQSGCRRPPHRLLEQFKPQVSPESPANSLGVRLALSPTTLV